MIFLNFSKNTGFCKKNCYNESKNQMERKCVPVECRMILLAPARAYFLQTADAAACRLCRCSGGGAA